MGYRHLSLGLIAAALFAASLPGAASEIPSALELTERVLVPHWTVLKLDVRSGVVDVEATVLDPPSPNTITFGFYDGQGRKVGPTPTHVWRGSDQHFLVATDAGPGFRVHFGEEGQSVDPPVSNQRNFSGWTGVLHVLIMGAGREATLEYTVRADDAVLLARSEGTGAHFVQTIDFEGPLNAHAQTFGVGARAVVDGEVTLVAERALMAVYVRVPLAPFVGQSPVQYERMYVRTPSGDEVECPCAWLDIGGPDARGPGEYVFGLHGANAMAILGQIGLVAADVTLPD